MQENWYAVEQQIRDRITEARAAAQIRALTQNLAPTAPCPYSLGMAVIRLARWLKAPLAGKECRP